jgi:hypothetical protein
MGKEEVKLSVLPSNVTLQKKIPKTLQDKMI